MIRAAKFSDIPGIVKVWEDGWRRSIYAETTAGLDLVEAKQMLVRSIQRHGHKNYGGTLVLVSESAGEITGFIIGYLDQVYPALSELMATDLLFIVCDKADPRDAMKMLKQLMAWAENNPKVIEVHLGVTSAIGDWERTGKMYERLGLTRCGAMYRRDMKR